MVRPDMRCRNSRLRRPRPIAVTPRKSSRAVRPLRPAEISQRSVNSTSHLADLEAVPMMSGARSPPPPNPAPEARLSAVAPDTANEMMPLATSVRPPTVNQSGGRGCTDGSMTTATSRRTPAPNRSASDSVAWVLTRTALKVTVASAAATAVDAMAASSRGLVLLRLRSEMVAEASRVVMLGLGLHGNRASSVPSWALSRPAFSKEIEPKHDDQAKHRRTRHGNRHPFEPPGRDQQGQRRHQPCPRSDLGHRAGNREPRAFEGFCQEPPSSQEDDADQHDSSRQNSGREGRPEEQRDQESDRCLEPHHHRHSP